MSDPIRFFYQHNLPDLSPITDPSHRHFRILLPRGTFLKIPDRIRTAHTLQRWLIRYRPSDVYYSTSCWLSPETLGRREKTSLAANIFLSSDIAFDIDRSPFSLANLEEARRETLRLLRFCDDERLPVRYIAFSGSKGFHVICSDTVRYDAADPREREDLAKERRREILARVLAGGIFVDRKITPDTRRIIRVPGTVNSKTGYVCTVLTREDLELPVQEILHKVRRVPLDTPPIPATGDDCPLRGTRIISWLCHRLGVRSKPVPSVRYATFLLSIVPGTSLQVPVFLYPDWRNPVKIEQELTRLQQVYRLSDLYLYRSDSGFAAICLATFPLERLEKILLASTSTGTGTLLKYRQLFFRVGEVRDCNGGVLEGAPVLMKAIAAPAENNTRFVSRPHYEFLSRFTLLPHYPRLHGKGEVFLTHTVIGTD